MRSRKKRRKTSPLTYHQQRIRQSQASVQTLMDVRDQTSVEALTQTLSWAFRRYRSQRHLGSIRPTTASQLPDFILKSDDNNPSHVKWMLATIGSNLSAVELHVGKLGTSTNLAPEYDKLLKTSLAELKTCWSYAALTQFLFALAQEHGLDGQRRWMNQSAYVSRASISNVVVYSKGIACEGDRHPSDIIEILSRFVFSWINDEETNLLVYYMTFHPAINDMAFNRLTPLMLYHPVVDQYELLANFVTSDPGALKASPLHERILQLMTETRDWRAPGLANAAAEYDRNCFKLPLLDDQAFSFLRETGYRDARESPTDRTFDISLANEFLSNPFSARGYLAASIYGLKTATSVEEVQSALFRRAIVMGADADGRSMRYKKVPFSFDAIAEEIFQESSILQARELFRIGALVGFNEGKIGATLISAYEYTSIDEFSVPYFPAELFVGQVSEDAVVEAGSDPRVAVALARVSVGLGDEAQNLVYLAVERFLSSSGLVKPSEISQADPTTVAFLREACTSSCLRQSLEFLSKAEMEDERLQILHKLIDMDPANEQAYTSEIHGIIDQQTIEELLQRFHVGKVQCDEEALTTWAMNELQPKFNRLKDFIDAGLLPVERNADVQFIAHLTSGSLEKFTFKVPSNESLDIARNLLLELVQKFALDPRYGVDSYLSLGMRHGSVAEHLRSPFSSENILTAKEAFGYPNECFWSEYYKNNGNPLIGQALGELLSEFSEKFDLKLEDIKDELLQVRRPEKSRGLVVADWTEASVLSFCARFADLTDLNSLISEFTSFFWANIDGNLKEARVYIQTILAAELNGLLDDLEKSVRERTSQQRLAPFSDALMRARQELSNALNDVSSWMNVARSTDVEPLNLVDIIRAAQKIVTRLYPDFDPEVNFTGESGIYLTSSLHILIEVFKALFTNVYMHSGVSHPRIRVHVHAQSAEALLVSFESECADVAAADMAAAENNEKIRTGEYEKKLPKEGGSGLAKVARATLKEGRPNTLISVDHERATFCVSMTFYLINL